MTLVCLAVLYYNSATVKVLLLLSCTFLPQAWSRYQKRISWVKALVHLQAHRALLKGSSALFHTCSWEFTLYVTHHCATWEYQASNLCKSGECERELLCFIYHALMTSEFEFVWSSYLSFLIWEHNCSFLCSDQFSVGCVFFPFFKYSELHLFCLNRHKPELRHKFRAVLSKVVVTKFSYKC